MEPAPWGGGTGTWRQGCELSPLESGAVAGDSPLSEAPFPPTGIPSRTGHVKPRLNPEGPPSKAEY